MLPTSLVSPWPVKIAMGHQHVWQKEPPDRISRTSDERYDDKKDLAHNSFWTSKEEIQELRLLLKKDPGFENSADWPMVVEWCSSCAITRVVKLVLSEEEIKVQEGEEGTPDFKVEEKKTSCDVCTQTPRQKPRRRGGQGSRTRRMLAYQLMLTVKRGLPLSRLLSSQKTEARSTKAEEQEEEPTLPPLKVKEEVMIKEEEKPKVREEREVVDCPGKGVSTSGSSTLSTLRNSQSGANSSIFQPHSTGPVISPFSDPPPPLFPPYVIFQIPQYCQMPAANWGVCGSCQCWGPIIPTCFVQ